MRKVHPKAGSHTDYRQMNDEILKGEWVTRRTVTSHGNCHIRITEKERSDIIAALSRAAHAIETPSKGTVIAAKARAKIQADRASEQGDKTL